MSIAFSCPFFSEKAFLSIAYSTFIHAILAVEMLFQQNENHRQTQQ